MSVLLACQRERVDDDPACDTQKKIVGVFKPTARWHDGIGRRGGSECATNNGTFQSWTISVT
jgi:hypothetical protein